MSSKLYIGSNGHVCAIEPKTGQEIWRTRLQPGMLKATHSSDVSVIVREGVIYAGSQGHLFALSCETGEVLWHNAMKGLGYNDVSMAFEGQSIQYMQKIIHRNNPS